MKRRIVSVAAVSVTLLALAACESHPVAAERSAEGPAGPPVQSGTILHWPETTAYLSLDVAAQPPAANLGPASPSGLVAFWSIATTSAGGSGFFYADAFRATPETEVADASSAARVSDIRDAAAFDYSQRSVGPVKPGGIVLVHHIPSARYLALVLGTIVPVDPHDAGAGPYAYADMTWYLAAAGSADFTGSR